MHHACRYLKPEDLARYTVAGNVDAFEAALGGAGKAPAAGGLVQVKSAGPREEDGGKGRRDGGEDRTASLYRKDGKKQKHGGGQSFKPNKKIKK